MDKLLKALLDMPCYRPRISRGSIAPYTRYDWKALLSWVSQPRGARSIKIRFVCGRSH